MQVIIKNYLALAVVLVLGLMTSAAPLPSTTRDMLSNPAESRIELEMRATPAAGGGLSGDVLYNQEAYMKQYAESNGIPVPNMFWQRNGVHWECLVPSCGARGVGPLMFQDHYIRFHRPRAAPPVNPWGGRP